MFHEQMIVLGNQTYHDAFFVLHFKKSMKCKFIMRVYSIQ